MISSCCCCCGFLNIEICSMDHFLSCLAFCQADYCNLKCAQLKLHTLQMSICELESGKYSNYVAGSADYISVRSASYHRSIACRRSRPLKGEVFVLQMSSALSTRTTIRSVNKLNPFLHNKTHVEQLHSMGCAAHPKTIDDCDYEARGTTVPHPLPAGTATAVAATAASAAAVCSSICKY